MSKVTPEDLVSDVRQLLDDVETMLQQAANATGSQAEELRDRAQAALRATQSRLHGIQEAARQTARSSAATTDDWVHANPWTAIGIAAGLGVVLGVLAGRR